MKKIGLCLLCLTLLMGITGCGKEKENNNSKQDEISIQNVEDYYINNYNDKEKNEYIKGYASYVAYNNLTNTSGSFQEYKESYKNSSKNRTYTFKDLNNDGIVEFILLGEIPKGELERLEDTPVIMAYTIDMETKEIKEFLDWAEYWDNLYYNSAKDIYLSQRLIENNKNTGYTGYYAVSVSSLKDKEERNRNWGEIYYDNTSERYVKSTNETTNGLGFLTRYDWEDGNMSKEEYLEYVTDLQEIKLEFKTEGLLYWIDEIDSLDNEVLKKGEEVNNNNNNNNDKNLKCTKKDVDNIVEILLRGEKIRVDSNTDIKISSNERIQNYNQEYPYATEYTISCGSYSKSVRISHK